MSFLQPFFQWCDATWLGQAIRGVTWAFPLIETIHILALAVLLGSILLMNLRLLDLWIHGWTAAQMGRVLSPYIWISLVVIVITGVLLFLSEALKAFDNAAFLPKIALLIAAALFHYTIYRKAAATEAEHPSAWCKIAAVLSLALWFGVGVAGRAIGFV
jgi:uncharacterized protein DUF6644